MGTAANAAFGGAFVEIPAATDLGFIKNGLHIQKNEEIYRARVEGSILPVKTRRTSLEYTFSGTIVEPTLANIILVQDVTDTIAGAGPYTLNVGEPEENTPTQRQVVFKGIVPGGSFVRTITVEEAVAENPGEMVITDAEEASLPFNYFTVLDTGAAIDRAFHFSDAVA
jgi:hypothetical protein